MDDDQSAFCQVRPVLADVSMRSLPRPPLGVVMPARRAAGEPRQAGSGRSRLASSRALIAANATHQPKSRSMSTWLAVESRSARASIVWRSSACHTIMSTASKDGVTAGTCEVYGRSITGTQRPVVIVGSHPDVPLAVAKMARRASQRVSGLRDHFAASSLPTRSASWRLPGRQAKVRVGRSGRPGHRGAIW